MNQKILSYLINLHTGQRPVYFSRHGESIYNTKGLLGGDSLLSPRGELYGEALAKFFEQEKEKYFSSYPGKAKVFCSTLKRSIQTAKKLKFIDDYVSLKNLDEINVGLCDGITYEEFEKKNIQKNIKKEGKISFIIDILLEKVIWT